MKLGHFSNLQVPKQSALISTANTVVKNDNLPSNVLKFSLQDWNDVYRQLSRSEQQSLLKAVDVKIAQKKQSSRLATKRSLNESNDKSNGNTQKGNKDFDSPPAKRQKLESKVSERGKNDACDIKISSVCDNIIFKKCQELVHTAQLDNIVKIVVGGIIFNSSNECLVLQRASNEFMPNIYEIASGTKEKSDATIIDCLKREVMEETGLNLCKIVDFIDSFDYKSSSGKATRQFTFLISVKNCDNVKISEEHSNYAWIKKSDLFEKENDNNKYNKIVQMITLPVRTLIRKAYSMKEDTNKDNKHIGHKNKEKESTKEQKEKEKEKEQQNIGDEEQDFDVAHTVVQK